jgi:hypothetical protein
MIILGNRSRFSWETYRHFFMNVWVACIKVGYSTQDAREFAQLEWDKFVEEQKQNEKS